MKLKSNNKEVIIESICFLYALLFVYAAVSKLLDFENFQVQLGQSPLLSAFAGPIAWIVPIFELVIVLFIVIKGWKLIGLFAAFSLMVMFTAYIYIILNYSSFVPCSCGGILEKMGWKQHLMFNIFFVFLAFVAILLFCKEEESRFFGKSWTIYLSLLATLLTSIGTVVLFFNLSEDIIRHRNNFVRRFPGDATKVSEIDLQFNSYYFAGYSKNRFYLGNSTAPLLVTTLDSGLKQKREFKIYPSRTNFAFQSVQIRILPPNFYLIDGSVPIIFKGKITDWKGYVKWNGSTTFSHYQLIDSLTLAFRSSNTFNGEISLGSLYFGKEPKVIFNSKLLQKQIDGIFDVDGMLHFDRNLHKLVYVYLYRNQFVVADKSLSLDYRGKTIDTVSKAKIKVATVTDRNERKLAAPPLIVNETSTVCKNLLFVNSAMIGKYEPSEMWKQASIIDIYDLNTNSYQGSFYVYHIKNEKLRRFFVLGSNFYGFIGRYLVCYKLNKGLVKAYRKL